jgi:DNA-binding transcriptional LysR family regulator
MVIHQLKSFVKIADIGNLRKAAEGLHISQSALSSQIKFLESRLDVQLFDRSAKGMELTENGRILYSHAQAVLSSAEIFQAKARELTGRTRQRVKIGINTDGNFLKVGKLSRMLTSYFQGIGFIFVSSQTVRTPEMLREELIDLGFFFGENREGDIQAEIIGHSDIRIVIPARIMPGNKPLTWESLAELPWIWSVCACPFYQLVQARMDSLGLSPNRFVDAMDESVVRELVIDNQGIGILREDDARYVASLSDCRIWEEEKFSVPLSIGMLRKNRDNPMHKEIVRLVGELWSGG